MRVAELSVRRLLLEDEELYSNQGPPVLFYAESGDPWRNRTESNRWEVAAQCLL
jgi:hypothetical protein